MYDELGAVRSSFVLAAEQTKGRRTRTVYLNKTLQRQLAQYRTALRNTAPSAALFQSQKGNFFSANTMCQLLLHIYKTCSLKDASSHVITHPLLRGLLISESMREWIEIPLNG